MFISCLFPNFYPVASAALHVALRHKGLTSRERFLFCTTISHPSPSIFLILNTIYHIQCNSVFLFLQLQARRCTWLYVIKDVLMSLSGKTPCLYRHDLIALHNVHKNKISTVLPMNKIPERLVPR